MRGSRWIAAGFFVALGWSSLSAQKMMVKVVSHRQTVEFLKSRKLPDPIEMSGSVDADRIRQNPDGTIFGGLQPIRVGGGRSKEEMPDTYPVVGMTYRLSRPDGQIAEVHCVSKRNWDGGAETQRGCRHPFGEAKVIQADFNGDKVKLIWHILFRNSERHTLKEYSETYELVSLSRP